jgi:hypothetical protein
LTRKLLYVPYHLWAATWVAAYSFLKWSSFTWHFWLFLSVVSEIFCRRREDPVRPQEAPRTGKEPECCLPRRDVDHIQGDHRVKWRVLLIGAATVTGPQLTPPLPQRRFHQCGS